MLYQVTSTFVILLKFISSPIQVSDVLILTVRCKIVNSIFQKFLSFFLKCLLFSDLTLHKLSTFTSLGACNHGRLASFLWKPNSEQSLATTFCDALIHNNLDCLGPKFWFFLWYFTMPCWCPHCPLQFSRAAEFVLIVNGYWSSTSPSFNFLRLNISVSTCYSARVLTASLSLTFATVKLWSV
jgi:hypothetical protein